MWKEILKVGIDHDYNNHSLETIQLLLFSPLFHQFYGFFPLIIRANNALVVVRAWVGCFGSFKMGDIARAK